LVRARLDPKLVEHPQQENYDPVVSTLFELAFARLDHAEAKRSEFATAWSGYIGNHPWEAALNKVSDRTFEMVVRVCEPTPPSLSLAFSDWLAALRACLDNGLYAWAVAISGQNPPPAAEKLQFPVATTSAEFKNQAKRLNSLPVDVIEKLERAQPYHSKLGHLSNLLFWVHELARMDRHRVLHLGLGRVAEHRVRIGLPGGIGAEFDTSVEPYDFIEGELLIARFTTSRQVEAREISFNPGIGIDPEIREWASFRLNGRKQSLRMRTVMTELFMRNHLENMAFFAGEAPSGGFRTFDPSNGGGADR
jgi:hypothetical protein